MSFLTFTIFGASGDLTFRKLIPALYNLYSQNLLAENFVIYGFSRREWSDEDFRNHLNNNVDKKNYDIEKWEEFLKRVEYIQSEFDDAEGYKKLAVKIQEGDYNSPLNPPSKGDLGTGVGSFLQRNNGEEGVNVFYMSVSPEYFKTIAEKISESQLCEICSENKNSRIVIEKPYGTSPENAEEVDNILRKSFLPEHIYRIDHFLGKESVQNILVFRFANSIFERLWNKENIDHIQIKADESLGIENRGLYYNKTGAIKDMVPNHILQTLALITMEAPASINSQDIQKKRLEILEKVFIYKNENGESNVVRGQYDGYKNEKDVNPDSTTETFIAMKLGIDNENWKDVPIYIRTGKKLAKKVIEISIKFKDTNKNIYDKMSGTVNDVITFRIQPDEGISLMFLAKEPGIMKISPVSLDFCYRPTFGKPIMDAYVGLIQNIISADQSLFTSIEEVKKQWHILSNHFLDLKNLPVFSYPQGSNGPKESDDLLKNDGREWIYNENYVCAVVAQ